MIELWIPITIFAAFCQNLRSAVQKHLKGVLSNTGATFSRFGYGFPFLVVYVLALHYGAGMEWPEPNAAFVIYGLVGGVTQIGATFCLVWLFSFRDFAVGTTYSKTETVQAALFGLVILGDGVDLAGAVAIFVSLIGVMLLSTAKSELDWRRLWLGWTERTALIGIFSGTLFGISAVTFRAASLSLGDPDSGGGPGFLMQAGFTLAFVILAQTVGMALWMAWREPGQLGAVLRSWRWASLAGPRRRRLLHRLVHRHDAPERRLCPCARPDRAGVHLRRRPLHLQGTQHAPGSRRHPPRRRRHPDPGHRLKVRSAGAGLFVLII